MNGEAREVFKAGQSDLDEMSVLLIGRFGETLIGFIP